MSYLAVDIGGTFIKSAVVNEDQRLSVREKIKTGGNQDNGILNKVESIVREELDRGEDIRGIGISTAGIVDREKGEIVYAGPTIPGYKGTPFKAHLSKRFGLPVHVENDVNAALLGEMWKGAGRGKDSVFCITLGTGIGGAFYSGGLTGGAHNQANAVGYLLKDPSGLNYEQRAATSALKLRLQEILGPGVETEELFGRARAGDGQSRKIINDWAYDVAEGLAQIIIMFDPAHVIIGGGISQQGDFLLDIIKGHIESFLPPDFLKTEFKIAELFNDAALYGAVSLFMQPVE